MTGESARLMVLAASILVGGFAAFRAVRIAPTTPLPGTWLAVAGMIGLLLSPNLWILGRALGARGSLALPPGLEWLSLAVALALLATISGMGRSVLRVTREREAAAAALRRSESRWRALVENPSDYVMLVDRDGTLRYLNHAAPGYRAEKVVGRVTVYEFLAPDAHEPLREALEHVFRTGKSVSVETYLPAIETWFDNRLGAVEEHGEVVAVAMLAIDINDRKRAERRLEDERLFFESVLEQAPGLITVCDHEGRVRFVNAASRALANQELQHGNLEDLRAAWGDVCLPDGRSLAADDWPLTRALRGEFVTAFQTRLHTNAGNWLDLLIGAAPIRGADGAIQGAVATSLDLTREKEAQRALAEQRALLDTVLERVPAAIFVCDASGRLEYVNAPARELGGPIPPGTLIDGAQLRWGVATDSEGADLRPEQRPLARALRGETLSGEEIRVEAPDGHRAVDLLVAAAPLRGTAGEIDGAVATASDISARRRAEEKLRTSEARLREAQRVAGLGSWEWDLLHDVLHWSDQTYAVYGVSPHEVEPSYETFLAIVHPEDRQHVQAQLAAGREVDVLGAFDHRVVTADHTTRWVQQRSEVVRDANGTAVRAVGTTLDVTERRRALERLQLLREIDQAILAEVTPEAIAQAAVDRVRSLLLCPFAAVGEYDLEAQEVRMLAVSAEGETAFRPGVRWPIAGLGVEDRMRWDEVWSHAHEVAAFAAVSPAHALHVKEGVVRTMLSMPLVIRGELIGLLSAGASAAEALGAEAELILREVADPLAIALQQAYLDQQLQRRARELEERVAERTAALQNFVDTVSHDLRAPLRAMDGFARALLEDCAASLDATSREYAERIVTGATRMGELIRDLLEYSRVSRSGVRQEPLSLTRTVQEVLDEREAEIRESGASVVVDEPLPDVHAHGGTLLQILSNLVSNAVKFAAPGLQPRVRIWAEREDRWVRVWVEDNGIGIDPKHREQIFEIFERLHGVEQYTGTGVGLAIAKMGAQRLGAEIGVESELGKGSRFWLRLKAT